MYSDKHYDMFINDIFNNDVELNESGRNLLCHILLEVINDCLRFSYTVMKHNKKITIVKHTIGYYIIYAFSDSYENLLLDEMNDSDINFYMGRNRNRNRNNNVHDNNNHDSEDEESEDE